MNDEHNERRSKLEDPSNYGYVEFPLVIGVFLLAMIIGFFIAWIAIGKASGESFPVILVSSIIIALATKPVMTIHAARNQQRGVELQRLYQEEQKHQREIEREEKREKKNEENGRVKSGKQEFDQEDFDVACYAIVMKAVKEARKAKAKVTPPGLLAKIMESIR